MSTNPTIPTAQCPSCPDPNAHATLEAARDPVCGMSVDPSRALSASHGGQVFFFCRARCRERFLGEPEAFLRKPEPPSSKPSDAPNAAGAAEYTRPMHPEVRAGHEDACPMIAAAAMSLSSVSVIANALRLRGAVT